MDILTLQYFNIYGLYTFSNSEEFRTFSKRNTKTDIHILSETSESAKIAEVVNEVRTIFPQAHIKGSFVSNESDNLNYSPHIKLIFTFLNVRQTEQKDSDTLPFAGIFSGFAALIKDSVRNQETQKTTQLEIANSTAQQINESMLYAWKIQKAMLPSKTEFNLLFPNHFIIYKPKHYVSGDFFWLKSKCSKTYFALADSTGHGVPGAFMSILGITSLNEISSLFNEWYSMLPSDILNHLRIKLINSLNQSGKSYEEVNDGIDIAMCIFDRETQKLQYAGANIPLYVVRNNILQEYRCQKMPVGISPRMNEPFTTTTIQLTEGDNLYLASDGYADQFGSKNNKKFKRKSLKQQFALISNQDSKTQKQILTDTLHFWQNGNEQTDDITVMGITISKASTFDYKI